MSGQHPKSTYKKQSPANIPSRKPQTQLVVDNIPISPVTQQIPLPTLSKPTYSTIKNLNDIKLVQLIQPLNSMMQMDRVVKLITTDSGSIHLHDEALEIFQRYLCNDVVFVGLWGAKVSDKSFFYEKILTLAEATEQDSKSFKPHIPSETEGMYFYNRPFVKQNTRIFLLDCTGYTNEKLSNEEKKILDILMSICEVVVLVQSPQQKSEVEQFSPSILDIGYKHFKDCLLRLYSKQKQTEDDDEEKEKLCWPDSLFILYSNVNSIKKERTRNRMHEFQLEKMFRSYNFSILHSNPQVSIQNISNLDGTLSELYLKNTSTVFKEIYSKIHTKSYKGLKFRGNTCPHILSNLTHALNTKHSLYLPRNFQHINKAVYQGIYNMQALSYVVKLKEYIKEEKPYQTDYLLEVFSIAYQETMEEYDLNCRDVCVGKTSSKKDFRKIYEQKLEEYIREKQRSIYEVNAKKSINLMAQKDESMNLSYDWKRNYLNLFRTYHDTYKKESRHPTGEFDENGKSYHIANKLKMMFLTTFHRQEPSLSHIRQKEEAEQIKILIEKRKIQFQDAMIQKQIIEKEYKENEQREFKQIKEKEKEIDLEIEQIQQKLKIEEEKYQKLIQQEKINEEKKNQARVFEYKKEELQKVLSTNLQTKQQIQAEIENKEQIVRKKQSRQQDVLQTKLSKVKTKKEQLNEQYEKVKKQRAPLRKAEIRLIGQQSIRRSALR